MVGTDCSEFPCIAVLEHPDLYCDGRTYSKFGRDIAAAVESDLQFGGGKVRVHTWPETDGPCHRHRVAVAAYPAALTDDEAFRFAMRTRALAYGAVPLDPATGEDHP